MEDIAAAACMGIVAAGGIAVGLDSSFARMVLVAGAGRCSPAGHHSSLDWPCFARRGRLEIWRGWMVCIVFDGVKAEVGEE